MDFVYYILSFLIVINIVVFVHEYGHYLAARSRGVAISTFSIGMGPELFGFTDKNGTRWSFSMFPIGGYVMMLGDGDIASATEDEEALEKLSEEDKAKSITRKTEWEKIFVAFMGPFFNYLYAFVVLVLMAWLYGVPADQAIIGKVMEGSAAQQVGLMAGDRVVSVDGRNTKKFRDVLIGISNNKSGTVDMVISRNGEWRNISVSPKVTTKKTWFGGTKTQKLVGIMPGTPEFEKKSFLKSIESAVKECAASTKEMFFVFGKLFSGQQSIDNFGGFVRMGQIAGDLTKSGNFAMLIMFTVTLSLNLGFVNLFPLPVLDGGRIVICLAEKILRRKLPEKMQEYVMMGCAIFLIGFMLFMTLNDIMRVEWVQKLIGKF